VYKPSSARRWESRRLPNDLDASGIVNVGEIEIVVNAAFSLGCPIP